MKMVTLAAAVLVLLFASAALVHTGGNSINKGDCTFKGIKLNGKVQIVTSFPDIKVEVVTSFPDLKVQKVSSFPDACGKWEFVNSFPDFKVQYVSSFPDIKIQFVDSFPGVQ